MNLHFTSARPWLLLACFALGISALLAILLVLSRAPHVQELFGLAPFFHTILVLHVNFAVLVWLLSFIGFIWVYHLDCLNKVINYSALTFCIGGALLMLMSPLVEDALPIMSNYVPVIDSPLFFIGLTGVAFAISILGWQVLRYRSWDLIRLSAVVWFVALVVLAIHFFRLAWFEMTISDPIFFFESLFWGAGHVVQFVYVLMLWLVWRWPNTTLANTQTKVVTLILVLAIGLSIFLDPKALLSRQAYTLLMQGGMFLLLLPMLWWWTRVVKGTIGGGRKFNISLASSALLILLGVVIGLLIRDDSVIVTAHYHATNAAVTIAFMGLAYSFIQQYSTQSLSLKWVRFQLILYAFGMILYVLGMAGSGWLGVPRKTAMTLEDNSLEQISMGIMGLGGALSIVATMMFVGFILSAFLGRHKIVKVSVKELK
ncbi:hypothetical protein MNBD_GAMMA04-1980 [hydrothermal vent metagenome]|uniref:Cytochrome oxidase subunit I profile domain-containing protein n=1 Tax=hydrothermal vent metagenome TaxID=652676 RepID=A0A3B0WF73_9ZZZZ